jgi:hypothetical protein
LHHDLIQTHRRDEQTDVFKREMATRVGIESVISELVRGHGLRQARYRGFRKTQLQAYFIGACANLKRLACVFAIYSYLHWLIRAFVRSLPLEFFNRVNLGRIGGKIALNTSLNDMENLSN